MRFFTALLAGASFLGAAVAQTTLAITDAPKSITAGSAVTIKYAAPDTSTPVTILLRKGDPLNLQDVQTLTTSATGGSFTFTPSSTLANGADYAFQIQQTGQTPNYWGPIALTGGAAAISSGSSTVPVTVTSTLLTANATSTITSTTSSVTLVTSTAVSAGLVSSMSRNMTMASASLTASSSHASSTGSSTGSSTAKTTSSKTSSASSSATSASSNGASGLHSPIALIFGAVAAMAYLN